MHGDAGGLANRHQARHDRVRVALSRADDLCPDRRRDSSDYIMDGWYDRDRLLVRIDAGEDAGGRDDAG